MKFISQVMVPSFFFYFSALKRVSVALAFVCLAVCLAAGMSAPQCGLAQELKPEAIEISGTNSGSEPLESVNPIYATNIASFKEKLKKHRRPQSLTVVNYPNDNGAPGMKQRIEIKPPADPFGVRSRINSTTAPSLLSKSFESGLLPYGSNGFGGSMELNIPTPPDCNADALIEVIANQITYGANGPQVPTRVEYHAGDNNFQYLFEEGPSLDVVVGDEDTISMGYGNSELVLRASAAYPTFNNHFFFSAYESENPQQAAIAVNGNSLSALMLDKDPFGPAQQSVQDILAGLGLLAPNGDTIVLGPNQALVFFELGTSNPNSSAFDWQDLILKITTQCPVGQEVVLRDSIGVGAASTNGNFPFLSRRRGVPTLQITSVLFPIQHSSDVKLSSVRTVISRAPGGNYNCFPAPQYLIRAWSFFPNQAGNLENPNIANVTINGSLANGGPIGVGAYWPISEEGPFTNYEVSIDLTQYNLHIPANQLVWVTVIHNYPTGFGQWCGIVETNDSGPSDYQVTSIPTTLLIANQNLPGQEPRSLHHGRMAFDLRAEEL